MLGALVAVLLGEGAGRAWDEREATRVHAARAAAGRSRPSIAPDHVDVVALTGDLQEQEGRQGAPYGYESGAFCKR